MAEKNKNNIIANSLLNPKVKKLKSAKIWQSYERKISLIFLTHTVHILHSDSAVIYHYHLEVIFAFNQSLKHMTIILRPTLLQDFHYTTLALNKNCTSATLHFRVADLQDN